MSLLCTTARHEASDKPRVHDGLRICWPCVLGIERNTFAVFRYHAELLADQAWRQAAIDAGVTGSREPSMPISPRKVDARIEIEQRLYSWAVLVADERGWYKPEAPGMTWACTLITSSCSWLGAHDLAVECYNELHDLAHGWVRSVARPSGTARATAGACPLCGAEAVAIIRPAEDERESMIVCRADPDHHWAPQEWSLVLGCDLTDAATVDTGAAVALLRISAEALRQLVARHRVERTTSGGFALSELQRLYGELWGAA